MNNNYKFSEEDYDVEIENIMKKQNMINEESMVYKDTTTYGGHAFSSKAEEAKYIKENCYVFFDETFAYIVEDDGMEDFAVYRMKKHHCAFQPDELEEEDDSSNSFEAFDVSFKVVSNRNHNVYVEGYVTINDENAEDVDWYYLDAQGIPQNQMFVEHDGVDGFAGATDEQEWEVEQFRSDYGEDAFWIDNCILQSDADENRTHVRKNCTLIINEGAKFEVEICKYDPVDFYTNYSTALEIGRQYFMTFKPKYNGESVVNIIEEYLEYGILENPYTYDIITTKTPKMNQEQADFNKDSIAMEVPKSCFEWEDDYEEDMVEEILSEYKDSLESAYRKALVRRIGIFGIASSMYEEKLKKENSMEVFNESGIQDFGNAWEDNYVDDEDLWTLANLTSEDVEKAVKDAWEEEESLREYP